jgi:oxalate---CoA ligase
LQCSTKFEHNAYGLLVKLGEQMSHTLQELLAVGMSAGTALAAPGRSPLTFAQMRVVLAEAGAALRSLGVGRQDRVAVVLPNGPEMASCFLACASAAVCAPLNPAYRLDEFAFYLGDLRPKILIVAQGSTSPALEVAQQMGLAVVDLIAAPDTPAGSFLLQPRSLVDVATLPASDAAQPDDIALVLHTSGTTARPKLVPLSMANLVASAVHIQDSLRLNAHDVALNIMPLFHIHGLVAGVLAPLLAGGQVFCTPGFDALKFFAWMDLAAPTWYTAVPTMHQSIVERAAGHAEVIARHPLRFVRSSSSAMPPQLMRTLERVLGAPLIEAYGMTEAAHQISANPPPPAPRQPGSVGLAAGPEVAIMDETGQLLAPGALGEIVVRGPNMMRGYVGNAEANAQAFMHGWFRTGDQGRLDAEGYLRITGRLKEIINRGGEKISPREIDEVLLDHPAVAQVVCFAMPHPKLGEEVAAVVVCKPGQHVTQQELQVFAAQRVAAFKVPQKIVFRQALPQGATGKLQRIGLAEKLGLSMLPPPGDPLET